MRIENDIFTNDIELCSYDVDPFYHMHATHYFRIMQEAAGAHAYTCNAGIPHLREEGRTWLVTRTSMTIDRYACWPGSIRVETWPQKPWKLYFPRVTRCWDQDRHLLFRSLSLWVVIDLNSHKPLKPDLIADRLRAPTIADEINPDLGRRTTFEQDSFAGIITHVPTIRYGDNDFNLHVNNVAYLEWMLDSLPFSFRDSHTIREVDISYISETYRDDTILVRTGLSNPQALETREPQLAHEVVRILPDGKEQQVCVAKTTWRERVHADQ